MTDEELLNWGRQGFIPFEGEEEEAFVARVNFGLAIHSHLENHLQKAVVRHPEILQEVMADTKALYGIEPMWVPLLFSNEKILPWQGGVALIFQLEEGSPLSALIQLREKVYPLFGTNQERLIHELAHIGRMGFNENKYEEMIAYRSSKSPFRRLIGPLFQSGWESILFASLLLLIVVFDALLLISGSGAWYDRFFWLKALPIAFLAFLLVRLMRRQRTFSQAEKKLPLSLLYCLRDEEIDLFAQLSPDEIATYIEKKKELSLRHRLIYHLYAKLHPWT